jgi:hydroxyacylglutathione hydrolase
MSVTIHPIQLGISRCFVIQADQTVLVDTGPPNKEELFKKALARLSIRPEEIKIILLTHGHWDHVGSARTIKEMTSAKIAMHQLDKDCLEKSINRRPPGVTVWTSMLSRLVNVFVSNVNIPQTKVDIVLDDQDFSMESYGIPGKIIHTPGHSPGSVSLVLENGDAIVGDLAMNSFGLRHGPCLPAFADDLAQVKQSWRLLLGLGVNTVHPAHGKSFSADIIKKAFSNESKA